MRVVSKVYDRSNEFSILDKRRSLDYHTGIHFGDNDMTLEQFIDEYRTEIDAVAVAVGGHTPEDDEEREDWVMNDEGLYSWAMSEGIEGDETDDVTGACDG